METEKEVQEIIEQHVASGHYIMIDSIETFYLDKGLGEVVLFIHGVPTSSFLFRKVVSKLENLGARGIAPDLPGLGFTGRPENFDYRFSRFAEFCLKLMDKLGIDHFHLLVHDIGAPIGLALAAKNRNRIRSITILNSMLDIEHFVKPLPMRPFEKPVLGELELSMMNHASWKLMMNYAGVENMDSITDEEIFAYIDILKRDDEGKAFLKIMRNFEQTRELSDLCYAAVTIPPYPVQLIWGMNDPFLPYEKYGVEFVKAVPNPPVHKLNGKHFTPEEFPEFIAEKLKSIIQTERVL